MTIAQNLSAVCSQIRAACSAANRPSDSVKLIAVSKTKPAEMILEAYRAGQRIFGENYVQELLEKQAHPLLKDLDIEWHLIGHLQSNKAKYVVGNVAMIHTIDKASLAAELSKRAIKKSVWISALLEINISAEASKHGLSEATAIDEAKKIFELPNLSICGLMTIASPYRERAAQEFQAMQHLFENIKSISPTPEKFTELSMGMSSDFDLAISTGATMVRVGTAIFGER
jgi:pyridoxal phosphate enzyme (YggS family)